MSYHYDRLANYSKQTIKIYPDKTGVVNHGESLRFQLPPNCLVDLDSLLWSYNLTTFHAETGDANRFRNRFMCRNSASIIKALYVYANDNLLDPCTYYNHLFNLLADHTAGTDFHTSGIRYLENSDPSVKPIYDNATGALAYVNTMVMAANNQNRTDNNRQFVVRNWLGFLGTCTPKVINTAFFGNVVIEIHLEEPNILWKTAAIALADNPVVVNANPRYEINASTSFMSITRIVFGDSTYYDLLRQVYESQGLVLPFYNYVSHRGNAFTKAAGTFTHQFNVNASHLTKLIGTCVIGEYQTEDGLLLSLQNAGFQNQLSAGQAVLFNQCPFFRKEATGLSSLNWEINNIAQYPAPITVADVYNQNLIALNQDNDVRAGQFPGMRDIHQFLKYWFMSILSFEHIQNTPEFVVQGLDGKAAAITCKMTLNFEAVGEARDLIPLVWSERQQMVQLNAGQQIRVIN
jgi:hypothetical protein